MDDIAQQLLGKRVYVRRDRELNPETKEGDGFDGVVRKVANGFVYIEVADPTGTFAGIWVNLALQREIAILQ